MAEVAYIKLFRSYEEVYDELTDEECGRLIKAMLRYSNTGEILPLTGSERVLFTVMRQQIDRDAGQYDTFTQRQSENGKKGGRPKNPKTQKTQPFFSDDLENPKNPSLFSKTQKSQDKEKEKEEEKDKGKDKDEETPPISPTGDFEVFWREYPKKVGKSSAKKAFDKVTEPLETLLAALRRQKCSDQWTRDDGRYIPNASTWLNQGRWEDELQPANSRFDAILGKGATYGQRGNTLLPDFGSIVVDEFQVAPD